MEIRTWMLASFVLPELLGGAAHPAEMSNIALRDGRVAISLAGEIKQGDAHSLKSLIKNANSSGKLIASVRLNSDGGNLAEAVEIAAIVQFGKIATVVANNAKCASACFVIFAAGAEKFVNYSSAIGVHGASDQNGRETVSAGAATVLMARIVKELGVPSSIIGRMVVTPPDQMVWLSPADLRSMGATVLGKPVQLPTEVTAPKGPPLELSPQSTARTPQVQTSPAPLRHDGRQSDEKMDWASFVRGAALVSREQNRGKVKHVRNCQPEHKICIDGIYFRDKDGTELLVKQEEDMRGKAVRRELCSFNAEGDVRLCVDWDNGAKHRDMKDAHGNWYKIADN